MAREVRTRNCAQQLPALRKSLAWVGRSIANTSLEKRWEKRHEKQMTKTNENKNQKQDRSS